MAADELVIRRVAGALGAEITGVDLARRLDDQTILRIRQALVEHQVIFFRDQDLTPAAQIHFGARFGPLNVHPYVAGMADHREVMEIIKEPEDRVNFGGGWHSDMSFLPTPTIASILYAVQVPDWGGDGVVRPNRGSRASLPCRPGFRAAAIALS